MKTCKDCDLWDDSNDVPGELGYCMARHPLSDVGLYEEMRHNIQMCSVGKILAACHAQRDRARKAAAESATNDHASKRWMSRALAAEQRVLDILSNAEDRL